MWIVKMLKLIYVHKSRRPPTSLLESLTMGYTHILTRPLVTSPGRPRPPLTSLPVLQRINFVQSVSSALQTDPLITNYGIPNNSVKNNSSNSARPRNVIRKAPLEEIAAEAEAWLGKENFSTKSSLSTNFGNFNDIITLFIFKVAHVDHPLLHLTQ